MGNDTQAAPRTPLERWMEKFRVTQPELAERCGLSVYMVCRLSTGARQPKLTELLVIAKVTLEIETELDVKEPTGVPLVAWGEGDRAAVAG
jgi:predicted transcriptional regulator